MDTNFKSDVRKLQRRKSLSGAQSFKECTNSQLGVKLLSVSFSCMSTEHIYAPNCGALSTEDYVFFFFL